MDGTVKRARQAPERASERASELADGKLCLRRTVNGETVTSEGQQWLIVRSWLRASLASPLIYNRACYAAMSEDRADRLPRLNWTSRRESPN